MSKQQSNPAAFPSKFRSPRAAWRKFVSALVLAIALVGLPVAASYLPNGLGDQFVQTVQAGGCQGGSCGRIGPRP